MKKPLSVFTKTLCVVLSLFFLLGIAFSAPGAAAEETDGKLRVHADGSFRILQIADLQDYYCPKDGNLSEVNVFFREINTIRLAIGRVQPDLIVFTGDNIQNAKGTMQSGMTVFEYSVKKITENFGDIPFFVTFGNHDQESNSRNKDGSDRLSEAEQLAIYGRYGALPLTSDIVPGDTSENATAKYGTGYVDIYSADGNTVVQRVILINSGTYDASRSPSQYGRVGTNAVTYADEYNDYDKAVSAVERWTWRPWGSWRMKRSSGPCRPSGGVGKKVAECVCLFGYGRLRRVPVDVWIDRAIRERCGGCEPFSLSGADAGVMQPYVF